MTEPEAYRDLLELHLKKIIARSLAMSEVQWNWSPSPSAPTTAALVEHAWVWLVSDRVQIQDRNENGFCPEHLPESKEDLIAALEEEAGEWKRMLTSMEPALLDDPLKNFGVQEIDVRRLVTHMVQNVIYKSGQLSANYFALGLDGTEPYSAPFPRDVLEEIRGAEESAVIAGASG